MRSGVKVADAESILRQGREEMMGYSTLSEALSVWTSTSDQYGIPSIQIWVVFGCHVAFVSARVVILPAYQCGCSMDHYSGRKGLDASFSYPTPFPGSRTRTIANPHSPS